MVSRKKVIQISQYYTFINSLPHISLLVIWITKYYQVPHLLSIFLSWFHRVTACRKNMKKYTPLIDFYEVRPTWRYIFDKKIHHNIASVFNFFTIKSIAYWGIRWKYNVLSTPELDLRAGIGIKWRHFDKGLEDIFYMNMKIRLVVCIFFLSNQYYK